MSTLACWAALQPLLSSRGPITRQGESEPRFPVQGPLCTVGCPPAYLFLPGVQASSLANRPGFEAPAQDHLQPCWMSWLCFCTKGPGESENEVGFSRPPNETTPDPPSRAACSLSNTVLKWVLS